MVRLLISSKFFRFVALTGISFCLVYVILSISLLSSSEFNELPFKLKILKDSEYDQFEYKKSHSQPEEDPWAEIGKSLRNLPEAPYILGIRNSRNGSRFWRNSTCARFATAFDIQFSNLYWQKQILHDVTFFLYNAYFDTRSLKSISSRFEAPVLRILSVADTTDLQFVKPLSCQLWFESEKHPTIVTAEGCQPIWYEKWGTEGRYTGFLINCRLPTSHRNKVPTSVSVVEAPCTNATNNLAVQFDRSVSGSDSETTFGVCVKGLDLLMEGQSVSRLVEWIELIQTLGAKKIFFYEFAVHENIKRVLNYYESKGIVEVTPTSLPGDFPNEPHLRHLFMNHKDHLFDKRKAELIAYNDCLYRNLYKYDFLAVVDTDEVIVPLQDMISWEDITKREDLQTLEDGTNATTLCFRNVYFLDDMANKEEVEALEIPQYFHMLRHIYRSRNHTGPKKYIKCFHKTSSTVLVHNHLPLACAGGHGFGQCSVLHLEPQIAHMQHYRSTCVQNAGVNCTHYKSDIVRDTSIWKYKEELTKRVHQAMNDIAIELLNYNSNRV